MASGRSRRTRLPAASAIADLLEHRRDGRIKMFTMTRALAARAALRDASSNGRIRAARRPPDARRDCVFAFARRHDDGLAITCVPRLVASLMPDAAAPPLGPASGATRAIELPATMPAPRCRDVFTGATVAASGARRCALVSAVAELFACLPDRAAGPALEMAYLTIIGGAFIAWLILVLLFTPHIPYHIEAQVDATSDHFIHVLESTCQTTLEHEQPDRDIHQRRPFYPAMLDAIRAARETINFECYIFKKGEIGEQFIDALCERARAGVRVTIVMDAIGSFGAFRRSARPLREAGCRVEPYQRMRWYSLARLNNRTHRELLVVDGRVAFVGGAGVADWWAGPMHRQADVARHDGAHRRAGGLGHPGRRRRELARVLRRDPDRAGNLQAARAGRTAPPPSRSRARRRIARRRRASLFQMLVEGVDDSACGSRRRISCPTRRSAKRDPPDGDARRRDHRIVVPGSATDQRWVRLASRRMYGQLLEAGVRIFEYQPGMTHVKACKWTICGR